MSRFVAHVTVMLKPLVNDPAGLAVRDGLHALGFDGVESVRVGKRLQLTLAAGDADEAAGRVRAMCDQPARQSRDRGLFGRDRRQRAR